MILDAIIGLFGSLFALLAEGVAAMFVPIVNLIAAGIEALIGLFVAGFSLGRIDRKPTDLTKTTESKSAGSRFTAISALLIVCVVVGCAVVAPRVFNRKVTFVAQDGQALPFAAVIVHTSSGDRRERTDSAGNLVIPRFTTEACTVKDPRYIERRWTNAELGSEVTVGRTVLGAGLDSLADRLLKPE